ncbi:MAG: ribose 5-phosphate isomerase B [Candidatus Cloacimonadota bacterium]|nr:MAG: ribose 5-phosphate isomerase B [Candidatus Cloacimonadota bacterium]
MKIGIGADHRGFKTKEFLKVYLMKEGFRIKDFGTDNDVSVDYPDIAYPLALEVSNHRLTRGILICGSGIGMCITANKVKGAYAALCMNEKMARMARNHNNANILTLGASLLSKSKIKRIVDIWLSEGFEGGRHRRRFNKLKKGEK